VGERIISDSLALGVDFLKSSPSKLASIPQQNTPQGTSHVHALDFSIGASFQANCKNKFGHDVTPTINSHRRAFLRVASFGRASFKLDIHTVAIALQSCFGGLACSYRVKHLRDRSFQFSVASTSVGFEIYNKSKVCTPMFELYINLWGNGGPNWLVEERKFYKESDSEWQVVKRKNSNSQRLSVFKRMQFTSCHPNLAPEISSTLPTASSSNGATPHQVLPGLIPFFKFPSFNPIQWPDDSYLTWFKAHGPAPLIQEVTSFSDFSGFLSGEKISPAFVVPASSHSPPSLSPQPRLLQTSTAAPSASQDPAMANIPIDPRPFVPLGYQIQHIEGRLAVKRVVVRRRPKEHEQYAIATIDPFPEGLVPFDNVRDVLGEFFNEVARVGFVALQPCPFGAAYVQFRNVSDKDRLISSSPNQFGDVTISFVNHDEGINWRGVSFNRDVWLLLVGPPLDHMKTDDLNACFSDIGSLLLWERDPNRKEESLSR
jgi:hypothetical protein